MTEIDKILEIENNEVGYLEKETNSQLDDKKANAGDKNYTKYARDMDALNVYNGKKQGYAWCNVYQDDSFVKAVGVDRARELLIGFSAGCTQDWNWFKAKGQTVSNPQRGDLVFFGDLSHVGIVEKVENGKIYTIEGNTSDKAELIVNGGAVCKKVYSIDSQYIYGYARPAYLEQDMPNNDGNNESNIISYPLLKIGSNGNYVRILQQILISKGYRLPNYGVDGDFGNETKEAVKRFQADNALEVDGDVGPLTWEKLNDSKTYSKTETYPGYIIRLNQISEDVRKVQYKLIQLNYNCGSKGADSIFGNGTKEAVKRFQADNGLQVDGDVGPLTWEKLF